MTSIGMNWLQKGRTLSSAPKAWYFATTSGRVCPFTRQRESLNTGTPSFSASRPVEQQVRNRPLPACTHPQPLPPSQQSDSCIFSPSLPLLSFPTTQRGSTGQHRRDSTEGIALAKGKVAGLLCTDGLLLTSETSKLPPTQTLVWPAKTGPFSSTLPVASSCCPQVTVLHPSPALWDGSWDPANYIPVSSAAPCQALTDKWCWRETKRLRKRGKKGFALCQVLVLTAPDPPASLLHPRSGTVSPE